LISIVLLLLWDRYQFANERARCYARRGVVNSLIAVQSNIYYIRIPNLN